MFRFRSSFAAGFITVVLAGCGRGAAPEAAGVAAAGDTTLPLSADTLRPVVITDTLPGDSDDPAIWVNPADAGQSVVLGTDTSAVSTSFRISITLGSPRMTAILGGQPEGGSDVHVGVGRSAGALQEFAHRRLAPTAAGGGAARRLHLGQRGRTALHGLHDGAFPHDFAVADDRHAGDRKPA